MYADQTPSVAEKSSETSSKDLPPSRKSRAIQPVSPPLSKVSLRKFIYTLTLILLLSGGAFYGYQMVQHKRQVGGWWNLLMGKSPIPAYDQGSGPAVRGERVGQRNCNPSDSTVEDRINALAEALGMPSPDLARAIAVAVRHHVPPASLSSITAKETGEAVKILTNNDETDGGKPAGKESNTGIFGGVVGGVENFVGMDEP